MQPPMAIPDLKFALYLLYHRIKQYARTNLQRTMAISTQIPMNYKLSLYIKGCPQTMIPKNLSWGYPLQLLFHLDLLHFAPLPIDFLFAI